LRQAEHAALWIFDIFAEEDTLRIVLQTSMQSSVYRISDAVFAGRKDFFVPRRGALQSAPRRFGNRRSLCRDVGEKLVRRRIFSFFRLGIFAANALLNLVIQLRVVFLRDYAFFNKSILPACQGVGLLEV